MPKFVCKETLNVGYLAFYKGKVYKAYKQYENGYIFMDEHGIPHLMNWHEIRKTFDIAENHLDFKIQ